jgi:hypothetical protein
MGWNENREDHTHVQSACTISLQKEDAQPIYIRTLTLWAPQDNHNTLLTPAEMPKEP